VGEPAFERIKKAARQAQTVKIYSFNSKSDVWWKQSFSNFASLAVDVYQFEFAQIQTLCKLLKRTTELSVTSSGDSLYVSGELGECEISCKALQVQQ